MHDLLAMHRHMAAGMFALARGGGGTAAPVGQGRCTVCALCAEACAKLALT